MAKRLLYNVSDLYGINVGPFPTKAVRALGRRDYPTPGPGFNDYPANSGMGPIVGHGPALRIIQDHPWAQTYTLTTKWLAGWQPGGAFPSDTVPISAVDTTGVTLTRQAPTANTHYAAWSWDYGAPGTYPMCNVNIVYKGFAGWLMNATYQDSITAAIGVGSWWLQPGALPSDPKGSYIAVVSRFNFSNGGSPNQIPTPTPMVIAA
jgi:hypothetical protein